MKRALALGFGILLCPALLVAAERSDGFPNGGKLVYGEYGRPATLDPITSNDMVGLRLTELLFNGLVSFSPKNDVVPDLARALGRSRRTTGSTRSSCAATPNGTPSSATARSRPTTSWVRST